MSWLASLRNDFTLSPFENQHTRSDSAAMASGPSDVITNQEQPEVQEECTGKKKSKFQTFKKFFARKKRKDTGGADVGLKASRSSDNVSKTSENNTLARSEKEKGSGSKISLNSKALSHDSVFVSDSEANEPLGASQDSIHGKVKSLQLQLKQAIRLGSPPSLMCVKKSEDAGTMSEDDGLPCSPPEYTALHTAMAQRSSSISLEGIDSDDEQRSRAATSRAVSPLVAPGDFSLPASPFACLDNSAAKHKLGLRHKACNKRKPVTRLEVKSETDSAVSETVTPSRQEEEEAASAKTEDGSHDHLKLNVEEEMEPPEESGSSSLRDEVEGEKGEDESDTEQDVSHSSDTSCPPEQKLPEEKESPDVQALPPSSSQPSSTTSSPHTPRGAREPSAGHREELPSPTQDVCAGDELQTSEDEDGYKDQENQEEEISFLQEVLSSLQSPHRISSQELKMDSVDMEVKEKEREQMEDDFGDADDVKEDHADEEDETSVQAVSGSPEEKQEVMEEEQETDEESKQVGDAEEEPLSYAHVPEEEEEEERVDWMSDGLNGSNTEQAGEKEEREEEANQRLENEEEEQIEEVEERREDRGEDEDVNVRMDQIEHVKDEALQRFSADEEVVSVTSSQGETEEEENFRTTNVPREDSPKEVSDPCHPSTQEEEEKQQEEVEDDTHQEHVREEMLLPTQKPSCNDEEAAQPDASESRELEEQDIQTTATNSDMMSVERDPSETGDEHVPSSIFRSSTVEESHEETESLERRHSSPTDTNLVQLDLVSPSSEQDQAFSPISPTDTHPHKGLSGSPPHEAESRGTVTAEGEEQTDAVEEKQHPEEEKLIPLSGRSNSGKTRFTIAPAWQRSQSVSPPPSPPPFCTSSPSAVSQPPVEATSAATRRPSEDEDGPTDPVTAEAVLSPSRAITTVSISTKHQSSDAAPMVAPQPSAAASPEAEGSVIAEGNPDNPFGVRLRKTSALIRLNSEEENVEPPLVSPTQPSTFKADASLPLSGKPSISQPSTTKPAIPKKPEVTVDSAAKLKRISDPSAGRGPPVTGGSDSPSWISVAKQKQKIYRENSVEEITIKKETREEQERQSSLPTYVSSAASRDHGSKPVSPAESSKTSPFIEKDPKTSLAPPTPVPPQPVKLQPHPCPAAPKPQPPPAVAKPPTHLHSVQRSLSPPTPVPVPPKSVPCSSPTSLSETVVSPQSLSVTSPPFPTRTATEKSASGPTVSPQRGLTPPALTQDEPPWMALAKKKAKAWSEMPQIVQ